MLIAHDLDEPCPRCGITGKYGNVNINRNILRRGCNHCRQWTFYSLPEVRKKIIYLDQFFLSHAFRAQEKPFVDAAHRIEDMAARQLIVCPYSSVHTKETHLWRHQQQENLFKFIKQTARGHKFSDDFEIKRLQLQRAFTAFRANGEVIQSIEESEVFADEIHSWDDYFWIDMRPILGNIEAMRQGKTDAIATLVTLFSDWAQLTTSYEEDMEIEAEGYGRSLIDQYLEMWGKLSQGNLMAYMDAPVEAMYVESLMHYDKDAMQMDERLARIADFFVSPHFKMIPHLRVSCGIFAILRRRVKEGAYTNQNTARKKLSGLFYDSNCISIFGPYCDAIFVDKVMKEWCDFPPARVLAPYNTQIFSVLDWDSFHGYLDQIEENYTDEMRNAIKLAYPDYEPMDGS